MTTSRGKGHTYIWPVRPPSTLYEFSTSGSVRRIQYCYRTSAAHYRMMVDIFRFFLGSVDVSHNGQFTFSHYDYNVTSIPDDDRCFVSEECPLYCCDETVIDMPHTKINAFGIAIIHNDVLPLIFTRSVSMYNVPQFQLSLPSFQKSNLTGLDSSLLCDESLPLLRLFIGPGIAKL